ncbi:MAG TPA: ribonuclease H-like domain-containing protein [Lacipirellulaceae bacterium]|nr:ribonuclease H-like domain-containing protein [Lacipirellulaceae bacterium]
MPGLVRGGDVVENGAGQHVRIRLPLESLWQDGPQLVAARHDYLRSQAQGAQNAIEPTVVIDTEFASFIAALPDRAIALDLETCGLAGSALFLIGLLRQVDGQSTVELLLARNYSEEAAILTSLWQTLADCQVLVTFNGKSFDWPMVIERSIRHRLPAVGWVPPAQDPAPVQYRTANAHQAMVHVDILHHARRRWRKHLPNCRLQTLEWHICRRRRTGDIPSHCIPAVYADYVRTGFDRDMDAVLHHNALDLVTLFDLALRMAA